MENNINVKNYKKEPEKFFIVPLNLRPKNHTFIKRRKINLTKLVSDYLEANEKAFLKLEYSERELDNTDRKVTSIRLRKDLKPKVNSVNMSYLVNRLIESLT